MDLNNERDRQDTRTEVTALIERAMRGDDSVWGEVYEKTRRYVYYIALKSLRNEQDAQDIAHDVYIQVIRSIGQLYSADSFYGWLRRIIFSKCADFAKKKKPTFIDDGDTPLEEIPEVGEQFLPDMVLDSAETRRMVMELIDALPDAQRQSVLFYYYDDMTVDQIAELMACSSGTVKSRLNYARAKIKAGVEEHERKGIKLYGVSALPILAILLREQAQAMEIPSTLGAGLTAILGGTSSTAGATATSSVGSAATKTATALSAKAIAGIVAAVVVAVGGITAFVLTRNEPPTADAPSGYVSETPSEAAEPTATATGEPANTAPTTEQGGVTLPDAITQHMGDLYDAFSGGDISLAYSLMTDGDLYAWFGSLDHKSEIFFTADSGRVSTRERDDLADADNYRDRLNYERNDSATEPHFAIEFVQSQSSPGQISMMVNYGKRENGFTYHIAWVHMESGAAYQFDWDDLTYQDGKATGAFKRYTFQPQGGDLFSYNWFVQSGETVDGFYSGDVIQEEHAVNPGYGEHISTWLSKYKNGLVQPQGGVDADGRIPYITFISDSFGTPEQPPRTRAADDAEWNIRRPYSGIGLG